MNTPRHSANDNSFGKSATGTAVRGVALLAAAVILGIVLLRANPSATADRVVTPTPTTVPDTLPTTTVLGSTPLDTTPLISGTSSTSIATAGGQAPSNVKVVVVNGSGITGKAGKVAALLKPDGWTIGTPVTASSKSLNSQVLYKAGLETEANTIAAKLKLTKIAPLSGTTVTFDVGDADIVVVVGKALANRV